MSEFPDDPLGPMAESAAAMHELYLAYQAAGFTPPDALYLCGVALAVIAGTEHAASLAERAEPDGAQALGHDDPFWHLRPIPTWTCAYCGLQSGAHAPDCPARPQGWRGNPGGTRVGLFTFRCMICGGPLVEDDGKLVCPDHRPPEDADPEEHHL